MPWFELGLICPSCTAKTRIRLEPRTQFPVCSRCGKKIPNVEIFYTSGFIYVLSNPSMPGLFKIGYTERDVIERAAELSAATGVPEPYTVEAFFPSKEPIADEAKIHKHLSNFRGTRKEFFRVDLQVALDTIYKVCGCGPQYCRPRLLYAIPDERTVRSKVDDNIIYTSTIFCQKCQKTYPRVGSMSEPAWCPIHKTNTEEI